MATTTAAMDTVAARTEPAVRGVRGGGRPTRSRTIRPGPDRISVMLFGLAAFLVLFALLATQLQAHTPRQPARPVLVLRRIYRTTIVETIPGPRSGTSVSQSVSSSGTWQPVSAVPTTRSSR